MNGIRLTLIGMLVLTLQACAVFRVEQVKPWQKRTLAEPVMQLNAVTAEKLVDEHIYFSKEASTGGKSIGGGGCGCN